MKNIKKSKSKTPQSPSSPASTASSPPSTASTAPAQSLAGSSSTTRIGKIARLPKEIRNELNERLQDGERGVDLVVWLNDLPKVQETLAQFFHGRPVTEQNLSEWRWGGYNDWGRHQAALERVPGPGEPPGDL